MANVELDAASVAQTGVTALRSGDARAARTCFERIVAAGRADGSVWYALALACQRLNDAPAMLAAVDRLLEADKWHIPALMMKADHYAALGDDRAALSFYHAVLTVADQMSDRTPEVAAAVQRAGAASRLYRERMLAHVAQALGTAGYRRGRSSDRFEHAVDLLSGAKRRYDQEPRSFFFPELPNVQFYPHGQFPWLEAIEACTDEICAELSEVMRTEQDFVPYIQRDPDRPIADHLNLMNKRDWTALFLWKDGAPVEENAKRCPKTIAALQHAPLTQIKGRAPSILFSRLESGARIPPHHGFINARLICHLPLITPPGCHFRVGNDVREWKKGQAWAFDDTIEHEAVNPTDKTRVVLIFEIWRPELTEEERSLVAALIAAVDSYQGEARMRWED